MADLFRWEADAPTGTFKNNAISSKVRRAAIAAAVGMRYVTPEEGYGKRKGESITIQRVSNLSLPTVGTLSESQSIPVDALSVSVRTITVAEWGRALEFSSYAADLANMDIPEAHRLALMDQMKLILDKAAFAAFKNAKIKYTPATVASGNFTTNGTAFGAAGANMNYYHLEQISDYLTATLNARPYIEDDYVGLFSTKAVRGLVSDPKFEEWNKYTNREAKMARELGRIERIRIVEVNNTNSLSGSLGTGSVLGEGVIFGADAVSMAIAQDPEILMSQPYDFGRKRAMAWYGILQFGEVWNTGNAGEANIVHVTST